MLTWSQQAAKHYGYRCGPRLHSIYNIAELAAHSLQRSLCPVCYGIGTVHTGGSGGTEQGQVNSFWWGKVRRQVSGRTSANHVGGVRYWRN